MFDITWIRDSFSNYNLYNRDFSNFNKDSFLKEISEIDFASLIVDDEPHCR